MTRGTKIALTVITLFVGVLVLYYGFLMPPVDAPGAGQPAVGQPAPEAAVTARPARETPAQPARRTSARGAAPIATPAPVESARRQVAAATGTGASGGSALLPALRPARQPLTPPARRVAEETTVAANEPITVERPAPPPASAATYTRYVVKLGDSLMSIAAAWFGDERKWELIASANEVDPRRLQVGQTLRLPPKDASPPRVARAAGAARTGTYTVRAGDTLSSIATAIYDDAARWRAIYQANRDLIGSNPDELTVGMALTMPR